ncbi:MAG: hypothetical protein ACRDRQ_26300 [Pseudonocardiaceae bacterium]
MSSAPVIENFAEAQRSSRSLAQQCIVMLCRPDIIERARQAPHPRTRALLDLLAAETTYDDADDPRFILPGDSDRRGRRLDELEVPALGPGLSTSAGLSGLLRRERQSSEEILHHQARMTSDGESVQASCEFEPAPKPSE